MADARGGEGEQSGNAVQPGHTTVTHSWEAYAG